MNQIPLSVVVITKNEESNITRCLTSVLGWADEVVVYDSGSVDKTVQVASKLGASVVSGEWVGFGPTKKKATLLAKNDWILSIDADEELPLELKHEIEQRFASLDSGSAYALPRKSYFLKKWILHGGWYPDRQVRLFNKKYSMWNESVIHEKVQAKSTQNFKNCLNHYVFKNLSHQVMTNDRYSTLQAQKMFNDGKKMNWFHFLTKPTVKFIECYILKLGFLDGYPGYVIARSAAYSVFLKWAKLNELRNLK